MSFAKDVIEIKIEDEMKNSYMDYSMSVIIGRALPDVRDGLKPVHRRILYAMHSEGLLASRKFSKCAGVVGEVLKKYHPHGDSAVYDALVRMAQPWNLRYLLVDGQGNFGSVDGDPAAAYRYTECKMTKLAEELLVDIEKQTVDFGPNFDGTVEEPTVLPSRFPNLLVNGAEGIAVGMATKIPPHNLSEIVRACVALIDDPSLGLDALMELVPGPDFPTYGTIYGRKGIRDAYETGRGRILVRGRAEFEELNGGRQAIIIDELPYQVNKARLIEDIADLVRDKRLDGVSALRDESDRHGMRIVIELKKDAVGQVVLNHLYKHTALESTFGVILLAIVNQQPRILTLKEMLQLYLSHRREVILRRTRWELAQAKARAHILEGFKKALDVLDQIITLIRGSANPAEARLGLISQFDFTAIQADAILELRLQRLTGMERQKILEELAELLQTIGRLEAILASEALLMNVVKDELIEVEVLYRDERRTRFMDNSTELTMHDLVAPEDQIVTLSHRGYIKRCSPSEWRMQKRGGFGKQGMATRDEDFVSSIFVANTHSLLLVFTTHGRVFPLQVFQLPAAGRGAKGKAIVNLVAVPEGERIAAVLPVTDLGKGDLMLVSRDGVIKRVRLDQFKNLRQGGLNASIGAEGDELVSVQRVDDAESVDAVMFTRNGKCLRFPLRKVRPLSRTAQGSGGIRLADGDVVVDALVVPTALPADLEGSVDEPEELDGEEAVDAAEELKLEEGDELAEGVIEEEDEPWETTILTVTELGYGKRTQLDAYPSKKHRNTRGVYSIDTSAGTGFVVGACEVKRDDQLMVATNTGRMIRMKAAEVRLVKTRNSKGVRLMKLDEGETIVDLTLLAGEEEVVVAEAIADLAPEPPPEA